MYRKPVITLHHIKNIILSVRGDGFAVHINKVCQSISRREIIIVVLEQLFRRDSIVFECKEVHKETSRGENHSYVVRLKKK